MPKEERPISKCKGCGAEIYWINYLGKKHPVDVVPRRGFVFIQDEYGNDIGEVELTCVHESHLTTCIDAEEHKEGERVRMDAAGSSVVQVEGVLPLDVGDPRTDFLQTIGKEAQEFTQADRVLDLPVYLAACEVATCREIREPK